MRWKNKNQILAIVKEHPGLFVGEITAIAYPDHVDQWDWSMCKQDVAGRLQSLKDQGRVRPIYTVYNCRNAGAKWEAVE